MRWVKAAVAEACLFGTSVLVLLKLPHGTDKRHHLRTMII